MFIFRKLRIKDHQGTTDSWTMILNSVEAVVKYMDIDSTLMTEAYFSLSRNKEFRHYGAPRENTIGQLIDVKINAGVSFKPFTIVSDLISSKSENMLNMVLSGQEVRVNAVGGYSDYASFAKIWNPIVLKEIKKETSYFPSDTDFIKTEYLFLENAECIDFCFRYSKELEKVSYKNCEYITILKEKDPEFVKLSIINSDNICIKSNLQDSTQLDNFMNLFNNIERKTLYLDVFRDVLESHELYNEVSKKHNIIHVTNKK